MARSGCGVFSRGRAPSGEKREKKTLDSIFFTGIGKASEPRPDYSEAGNGLFFMIKYDECRTN